MKRINKDRFPQAWFYRGCNQL